MRKELRCQNLFTQDAGLHQAVCLLHKQREVRKSLLYLKNPKKLHFDLIVHFLPTGGQMCKCVCVVCPVGTSEPLLQSTNSKYSR